MGYHRARQLNLHNLKHFLNTPHAKKHVHDWSQKISDVLENFEPQNHEQSDAQETHQQEKWMILSDFYKSGQTNNIELPSADYDWTADSMKYSSQQIGEMPSWILTLKENFQLQLTTADLTDVNSFSEMQKLAYDIIAKHSKSTSKKEALLLIINGVAGTGKSYLIIALKSYLKQTLSLGSGQRSLFRLLFSTCCCCKEDRGK